MKFRRLSPLSICSNTVEALGRLPLSIQRNCHVFTSVVTICLSATILGVSSHLLQVFNSQKNTNNWWLPLWPQHFDTKAIPTTIGISSLLIILALLHLGLAFIPWISKHISRLNIVTLVFMLPAFGLAISAFTYAAVLNNRAPYTETIQSWTCRWSATAATAPGDTQAYGVPGSFSSMCMEAQFTLYGLIPIFIFQSFSITIALLCLLESRQQRNVDMAPTTEPAQDRKDVSGTATPENRPA